MGNISYNFPPLPPYPLGQAPECRDIYSDGWGGEGGSYNLYYPNKLALIINPLSITVDNIDIAFLGVANLGKMNKPSPSKSSMNNLSPNVVDVLLNSPPYVQTPEHREHPPPPHITATFWEIHGPQTTPPYMHDKGEPLSKIGPVSENTQ